MDRQIGQSGTWYSSCHFKAFMGKIEPVPFQEKDMGDSPDDDDDMDYHAECEDGMCVRN